MVVDPRPMFSRRLTQAGHVHQFSIASSDTGWEVREEHDSTVVRRTIYTDWRRVERAQSLFALRAHQLERTGWTES
jgi:hypothetical protein